jgi:tetratricopeptide (TPR) repeat protein
LSCSLLFTACNGRRETAIPVPEDPPKSEWVSPYRNLGPEVKYVGDKACAGCHPSQAETFRHHPMGRSMTPISHLEKNVRFGKGNQNPFVRFGLEFQVEPKDDKLVLHEVRRDAKGGVAAHHEEEMRFVLGSGASGHSFLIDHDGYLFQSPASWFSQKSIWDLSPGFTRAQLTGRPVPAICLFCHSNHANPIPDTDNRYRQPIFDRLAIGCERCHGPGELHAQRRERGEEVEGLDDTIVNPSRLPSALREAVCQQCHLLGNKRFLPRGRDTFDYRPGLALHKYWAIFVYVPKLTDDFKAVGQVEQMYGSRCFEASKGKMGCISCHDPHALPALEKREGYYRSRCLKCHQEKDCGVPLAVRKETTKEDSCIHCHMPQFAFSQVPHTAGTDHRIRKSPQRTLRAGGKRLQSGEMPIVNFYRDLLDPADEGANRDLGVALAMVAEANPNLRDSAAALAVPLLEKAVQEAPDDVLAWGFKAQALWHQDKGQAALDDLEKALAQAPRREFLVRVAAAYAEQLGRDEEAIGYWQRAAEINPWRASYHEHLARLLAKQQNWPEALGACQAALRFLPADIDMRLILVTCYLRIGNKGEAEKEMAALLALEPPNKEELRRWFDQQGN